MVTPEFQAQACHEFMRRIDAGDVCARNYSYLARELSTSIGNVALQDDAIYAHLLFDGDPLLSVPFVNEAVPGPTSYPESHAMAAYAKCLQYGLSTRKIEYWSLYIFPSAHSDTLWAQAWVSYASPQRIMAARKMLALLPRIQLMMAFDTTDNVIYRKLLPYVAEVE